MNKIEVGKSYTRMDGRIIVIEIYDPCEVESLHWRSSDGMWRNENGDPFPGSKSPSDYDYRIDWSKSI